MVSALGAGEIDAADTVPPAAVEALRVWAGITLWFVLVRSDRRGQQPACCVRDIGGIEAVANRGAWR